MAQRTGITQRHGQAVDMETSDRAFEFIRAMCRYITEKRNKSPNYGIPNAQEVLAVAKSLGYKKETVT